VVPVKGMNGEIFAEMLMTQDITERKQMEEQLRQAATVDGLTGLLNRRRFTEAAENMVRHARRYGTPLCLCMCDIDHFKHINDTHGHKAGDNVLQGYGALLRQCVRETDFVGRYGGDEFCILLPGTPLDEAVGVIERVRHLLEEQAFENDRGEPIHVTGSFGVASFGPKIDGIGTFFEAADAALYESKRGGRNRVTAAIR
jgi:diguanylate cyclase (GGDEF)-like protein